MCVRYKEKVHKYLLFHKKSCKMNIKVEESGLKWHNVVDKNSFLHNKNVKVHSLVKAGDWNVHG